MKASVLAGQLFLAAGALATSLTYRLDAHEKACFYADTQRDKEKVAFYFAVR